VRGFLTSDVVAAVLAHFPAEKFESTSTEVHAGFRELGREFPELLGHVSFGRVGEYVASDAIDAALDSLAASSFYSRYNKDLVTYELNKDRLGVYYRRFLAERFTAAEVSEDRLVEAATRFHSLLEELHGSDDLDTVLVTDK